MTRSQSNATLRKIYATHFNMEEDNFVEADYVRGFNEGYMLAKYASELAEQLAKVTGIGSRLEGAKDASEVYLSEQFEEHLPDWLKDDPFNQPEVLPQKEKDKDIDLEL